MTPLCNSVTLHFSITWCMLRGSLLARLNMREFFVPGFPVTPAQAGVGLSGCAEV